MRTGTTKRPDLNLSCSYSIPLPEEELWYSSVEDWDPPQPSMENPILYKGWFIYYWTGWKGNWAILNPLFDRKVYCYQCGKLIECGDMIYHSQAYDKPLHAKCRTDYHGRITSQWIAVDREPRLLGERRYFYASAPGNQGPFNKGDCFDICPDLDDPNYYTDPDILLALRAECFERLKGVIDANL